MALAPASEHQRIQIELGSFLLTLLKRTKKGTILPGVNIISAEEDYRIPDLAFVAAGRERIIAAEGIRGAPDAVIEIRSPDDETYEKFPLFASLGVREVIVVDRDSKRPEVFRLAGPQYLAVAGDTEGWMISEALGVRLRAQESTPARLTVEDLHDPAARVKI